MKHGHTLMAWAAVGLLIAVVGVFPVWAQGGEGDELAPARGAALYAEFCQACHAPDGSAQAEGPAFAAIRYDAERAHVALADGITGENGVFMPAYSQVLDEAALDDLLAYMATWGTGDTPPLPEPNLHVESAEDAHEGDPGAGAVTYAKTCYGCHATEGAGRGAEGFPAFEWDRSSLDVVSTGGDMGAGHAFGVAAGGPLSDTQLGDLAAYIASWEDDTHPTGEKSSDIPGLNIFLVVIGVAAILIIGGAYGTNLVRTET